MYLEHDMPFRADNEIRSHTCFSKISRNSVVTFVAVEMRILQKKFCRYNNLKQGKRMISVGLFLLF